MRLLTLFLACALAGAAHAQLIVGFDSTRGGSYNLQAQTGAQTAFSAAFPTATFSFVATLDSAALSGAQGVIIMSARDNINPVTPLTGPEQSALAAFVAAGGFAIIATESDYTPTLFDVTNDSFLAPFGFSANGMYGTPITITAPGASPITNGPFGLISSLTGIASGSYLALPPSFQALGTNPEGFIAAGYIARDGLNPGSGAVLFVSDSNVFNISVGGSAANYNLISNFAAFAAVPEPASLRLMLAGLAGLGIGALRQRCRRP